MKATLLRISKYASKLPDKGDFLYLFFKGDDGRSFKTCLYPKFGNFSRWNIVLNKGIGAVVDNLNVKANNLIDADSFPKIIS